MILDNADQVMTSYAPTAIAAAFQNYLDRKVAMENGAGAPLFGYVNVAAAATSGGSATVLFELIGNQILNLNIFQYIIQ